MTFNALRHERNGSRKFDSRIWCDPALNRALLEVFHKKCAYCETRLVGQFGIVEHFRPKTSGMEDRSFTGYWWLAYEWQNLLVCCQRCNMMKANRFPIKGKRASPTAIGSELSKEKPLLLDPCIDKPDEHLAFDDSGAIAAKSERGRVTIQVLGLNREELVENRKREIEALVRNFVLAVRAKAPNQTDTILHELDNHDLQYAAACRAAMHRKILELQRQLGTTATIRKVVARAKSAKPLNHAQFEQLVSESTEIQERTGQYSVESEDTAQSKTYLEVQRRVERIQIRNFKSIEDLSLQFPGPQSDHEAWLMLLGENATGKSSVLQAVALALMGNSHANSIGLDAQSFVRHNAEDGRGFVEIHLTNLSAAIRLEFGRGDREFRVEPTAPKVLLLGYGATRLLPRPGLGKSDTNKYIRIKNLFDPTAPLNNADNWLADERKVSNEKFQEVSRALKSALLLPDDVEATRENGKVEFVYPNDRLSLLEMSDGYQSVTAMVADIAFCVLEKWPTIEDAEAVVLLDEIEVHLHPRWKMTIVKRLRKCFPRLSFIATTHDPLCLRGLYKGEIVVFRRNQTGKIEPLSEIPELDDYRADQLLTSPLFELATTRGPQIEADRARYAHLLEQRRRTKAEQDEFLILEEKLSHLNIDERTPSAAAASEGRLDALVDTATRRITADLSTEIRQLLTNIVGSSETGE
jgi:uncharacterized protein (TIGR02646 family)